MAARPATSKNPRTATAIRFPEELHERLRDAAEAYGLPLNFLVVKAMEEFLDNMIPPSEFRLTRGSRVESVAG
jgi:predicted DNA-binding protein